MLWSFFEGLRGQIREVRLKVDTLGRIASWVELAEPLGGSPKFPMSPSISYFTCIWVLYISVRSLRSLKALNYRRKYSYLPFVCTRKLFKIITFSGLILARRKMSAIRRKPFPLPAYKNVLRFFSQSFLRAQFNLPKWFGDSPTRLVSLSVTFFLCFCLKVF